MYTFSDSAARMSIQIRRSHAPPGWIVDLVATGELAAVYDTRILAEYRDVLTRSRLNLDATRVQLLLDVTQDTGIPITPMPWQAPLPDPDDEPFIACAKMAVAPLLPHLIHHRAVARGRQVLWPGRFATERTGSVLACKVRMRDQAKRRGRGAWRLRSRQGGE